MTSPGVRGLVAATLAGLLLAAPAAAADEGIAVRQARDVRFPERAFVVTLPQQQELDAESVQVLENGRTVDHLSVAPAGEARRTAAIVLLIDGSNSMRGKPIEDAFAAARVFAQERNPLQKLAIVTFNSSPTVLLSFSDDASAIDAALSEPPPLANGTHLYDGVATALSMIKEARLGPGAVVLLSDGADAGSSTTAAALTSDASARGIPIHAIGLRGRGFAPETLSGLAGDSGGEYIEAGSSKDLAAIYAELGERLANEYVIRYRSLAPADTSVVVEVTVDGFAAPATADYHTPAIPKSPTSSFRRSVGDTIWASPLTMVVVALISTLLFVMALLALIRPRNRNLRRRMGEFVSLRPPDQAQRGTVTGKVLAETEKSLERTQWWTRFKEELEIAEIRIPAIHIVMGTAVLTLFVGWLVATVSGISFFIVFGALVPMVVRAAVRQKLQRKRNLFAEQLPDNLQVLASALRAGHSFVGALSVVVDDSPEPAKSEFRRVIADEQLGVPLEDALEVVVRRMDNRDLEQVSLVAALQREAGGNSAEVLDRVTETIRGRFELRRLIRTLTAQGRMSRWVVSALPVVLLLFISAVNPGYLSPLIDRPVGRFLLGLAAAMVIAGSLVIKRIVNIKV
jgi:tight adherence protein B